MARGGSGSPFLKMLWDVKRGELLRTLTGHQNWVFTLAYRPDGKQIASGDKDGRIILWDAGTGEAQHQWKKGESVSSVVYSGDGRLLASSSSEGMIRLWRPDTGKLIRSISVKKEYAVPSPPSTPKRQVK